MNAPHTSPLLRALRTLTASCALLAGGAAHAQPAADLRALTLPGAESLLGTKNRDIAMARRALDQARAEVQVAGQRPNPQFTWSTTNINPRAGVGSGSLRDKTVDSVARIDQVIERGNKQGLRVDTARQLEAAAGEDLSDTGRQQMLALRAAYYDLLAAQEKVLTLEEAAQLFGRSVDAAQVRQRAGDLAASDVSRIRVDALRAQNDARSAQADLGRARLALAYLIGAESQAAEIRAAGNWPSRNGADAARVEDLVNQRPDVRAAQARVQAADRARELAQAQRTRDFSVGVQVEHYPSSQTNTFGSGNSVGVSVSVPLFVRHNNEGNIARAQADWYAARDNLERTRALATGEVLRARGDLDAAADRLARFETELLPAAQRTADAAEFAFRNGAMGVMDLLDARRTQRAVLIDAANARADYAKAQAAWQANVQAPGNYMTGVGQ